MGSALHRRKDSKVDRFLQIVGSFFGRPALALLHASTLQTQTRVKLFFSLSFLSYLAIEDHGAARTAQRLVRRCGHHVAESKRERESAQKQPLSLLHVLSSQLKGIGEQARRHQTGKVRHVAHQIGAAVVRDFPHLGVVEITRISDEKERGEQWRNKAILLALS